MFGLRNVFGADGSVHQEQQVGSMRLDLTNGRLSQVMGEPGGIQTVVGPDGSTHLEQVIGTMRINLTSGGVDTLA